MADDSGLKINARELGLWIWVILGIDWVILGFYGDNGKEIGNYYLGFREFRV